MSVKTYSDAVCKGAFALGTACGVCEKCKDERAERAGGGAGVDFAITVLNRALAADKAAIGVLLSLRTPCNDTLANDPTIQVRRNSDETHAIGMLGLINGLFGVDDRNWGHIAMVVESSGDIVRFERTQPTPPIKPVWTE
jgi:hypothetical protein